MKELAFFDESQVLLHVSASDKWGLIESLVDRALTSPPLQVQKKEFTRDMLVDAVTQREKERSTGLGNGIAFPHARLKNLKTPLVTVALPSPPVDFVALDGKPASLVVLILVPDDQPQLALQLMSQFARLLSTPENRNTIQNMQNPSDIGDFILHRIIERDIAITARDIMRDPVDVVQPDMPLREVTRFMNQRELDTVAVCEPDGTLVGEITCNNLFKLGMPDFFTQLKSVAFIRQFDPFEKYFADEGDALARGVMSQEYSVLPTDATLLEIVFELAVRQRPKIYIVSNGKYVGGIDRILVLERVINI